MKKIAEKKYNCKLTDVSVQPTGKWIERINQSERALR